MLFCFKENIKIITFSLGRGKCLQHLASLCVKCCCECGDVQEGSARCGVWGGRMRWVCRVTQCSVYLWSFVNKRCVCVVVMSLSLNVVFLKWMTRVDTAIIHDMTRVSFSCETNFTGEYQTRLPAHLYRPGSVLRIMIDKYFLNIHT